MHPPAVPSDANGQRLHPQRRHNYINDAGKKDPKKRDLIGRATFTKFAAREAAQTKVINADTHLYG